jgi:putative transposase
VGRLCKLLKVSRSGYYDYLERGDSCRSSDEMALITRAREIHRQNKGVYGSTRMSEELQSIGYRVGRYRARTLMLKVGITVKWAKRFKVTTNGRHNYPVVPSTSHHDALLHSLEPLVHRSQRA